MRSSSATSAASSRCTRATPTTLRSSFRLSSRRAAAARVPAFIPPPPDPADPCPPPGPHPACRRMLPAHAVECCGAYAVMPVWRFWTGVLCCVLGCDGHRCALQHPASFCAW